MQANRSIPAAVVLPELAYPDVNAAADWLCRAFGFTVRLRIADHRVQLAIPGGGAVIARRGAAPAESAASHSVMVRVDDVDAHHARALAAGVAIQGGPETYPFGERQYGARDPGGHHWVFTQSVADVDPADWGGEWGAE